MTTRSHSIDPPLMAFSGSLPLGGSTTFLVNLAREFQRRDLILPIVALTEHYEHQQDFEAAGADVSCISTGQTIYEDRLLAGYQHARQRRPHAVLACLSGESFEMLRLVPPRVLRMGIIQSDDPGPYSVLGPYGRWIDVMVGVSEQICDRMRAMPECRHMRIACIPYGIHFAPAQPRPASPPDSPLRIVYIGRIIETQKRISRLIHLIQMTRERQLNVQFTIIGSGPEAGSFKQALAGYDHVRMLGSVPNREITTLLQAQDIFILLSDFEGLPLSLLEAMGEGVVPVISDLAGGIRDAVSSDCGVRVPVGDVPAACDAIASLVQDRAKLANFSRASAERARGEFSSARMANQYLNLIREHCDSSAIPEWPERITVPAPLGLNAFMFDGWPRKVRRWLKGLRKA